ncbi:ComF family protein [Kiritimatiella glycovorans]|uniref:DNA utilization protein GntX n=1 Tax=Kiritimatiella glycovorans TaxID=1307763 RepID=A0A0G3EHV3_9BACT|nr:ComF family protein [Kiritimatiella glycovorans]AKJ64380.1 DNA utilization protein GntX [Kiritimatiella glycovorans]
MRISHHLTRHLASPALDLVYPRRCCACGARDPAPLRYLCWDCWSGMHPVAPPFCARCGDPVAGRIDHEYLCHACTSSDPAFDRARSAVRYDGPAREMLIALKYRHAIWLVPDLALMLEGLVRAEFRPGTPDAVVPVPLHRRRRRDRAYNQAGLIAGELARRLGVPCRPGMLKRVRDTGTQTRLTAAQRESNMRGAFRAAPGAVSAGAHILLIDDTMTTGATVRECARAFKLAGASKVDVATVARG